MRPQAQTASIENGGVLLPAQAPWLADHVAELTNFRKAKTDDQVDATAQALSWIKSGSRGPGMGLFRDMQEEARQACDSGTGV